MIYFSKHIALWKCHFSTNIELTPTNGLMSNFIQIKDFHTLKKKKSLLPFTTGKIYLELKTEGKERKKKILIIVRVEPKPASKKTALSRF